MPEHQPAYSANVLKYEAVWQYGITQSPKAYESLSTYYSSREECVSGNKHTTTLKSGIVNGEYAKTEAQYLGDNTINIKCVSGEGIILMQKLAVDNEGRISVENFSATRIQEGTLLTVPPNFYIVFVNTGLSYLTIEDDSPEKLDNRKPFGLPDTNEWKLIENKGFLYEVIKGKDGKPSLKNRLSYRNVKREFTGDIPLTEMD